MLNALLFVAAKMYAVYAVGALHKRLVLYQNYANPELGETTLKKIIEETWHRRNYRYEPFTQFKEVPRTGRYVNITPAGFRVTHNQGPWPPTRDSYSLFLFGGSTTFGYGVQDDHTIASFLQGLLGQASPQPLYVYNFGRGGHYSTQERLLFEQLIIAGFIPDMAIFIDGLNDAYHFADTPDFTELLARCFQDKSGPTDMLRSLPMFGVAEALQRNMARWLKERSNQDFDGLEDYASKVEPIFARYLHNTRLVEAIASRYGITTLFVWQPVPSYKYDWDQRIARDLPIRHSAKAFFYPKKLYEYIAQQVPERLAWPNFLWAADLQDGVQEPLYIDEVHYSAAMSRRFAAHIATVLRERQMLQARSVRAMP